MDDICGPEYSGNVAHPIYCAFFYFCVSGTSSLRECPNGLYYNPRTQTCDFQENVPECDEGTRPPTSTGSTTAATTTSTTPETPEPEPTITHSPPTASTSTSTTTRPTTTSPSEGLTCPPGQTRFYPYPKDCTRYYFCQDGVFSGVRSCTSGLWFNFDLQACRTPWDAVCPY